MSILTKIFNWISGAAKKVAAALSTGNKIANSLKTVADSPLLTAIVKLTATNIDNQVLEYVRTGLTLWVTKMGWSQKKISDFDETTLPHVMNAINAEAAKLSADFAGADLSRQQAIASAQVVYDSNIVK